MGRFSFSSVGAVLVSRLVRNSLVCVVSLAALLIALPARASVVPKLTFEQIVQGAELVFTGTVVRVESVRTASPSGRTIVTHVTYRVDRMLQGDPRPEITLEFLGGQVGDVALHIEGVPAFAIGQEDVICAHADGLYVSPLTGFNQGRFAVTRDAAGRRLITDRDGRPVAMAADALRSPTPPGSPVTLEAFEQEVLRVLAMPRR